MNIEQGSLTDLENKVALWANERGLVKQEFSFRQLAKTMEELGEVAGALCKNKEEEFKDGIGDVMVCLIILARQNNTTVRECLEIAYNTIKQRNGQTINGTFVKQDDLIDFKRDATTGYLKEDVVMKGVPKLDRPPSDPEEVHVSIAGEVMIPIAENKCHECKKPLNECFCD